MTFENIIQILIKILQILLPLAVAIITFLYWKESKRTAQIQLFESMNNIVRDIDNDMREAFKQLGQFTFQGNITMFNIQYYQCKSIIEKAKAYEKVYKGIVEKIDNIYNLKNALVSASFPDFEKYKKIRADMINDLISKFSKDSKLSGIKEKAHFEEIKEKLNELFLES